MPAPETLFTRAGLDTRYRLAGEGIPVALIHGVGSSLEAWDGVVEGLGAGYRSLRYDLRGHGASAKPPGPYDLDDFTGDLAALLDHVGFDRCHVVGFSLGGLIAQAFALAHPGRVERLALVSTVAGRTEEEKARVRARLEALAGGVSGDHFIRSIDRWFTPAFQATHTEVIARLAEHNKRNDPAAYAAAYRVLAEGDLADRLHLIEAETLVMTGEEDIGSNPRMARLMQARIPDARLEILPGLRHSILIEAPDRVAEALRAFL
jgi:pimeloyl-ACP methyl ester carboxylesterase